MTVEPLHFRPIDVDRDAKICISHRLDSYTVSFGDPDRFYEQNGPDGARYMEWLRERAADEGTCVFACRGDEIVGQIESIYSAQHRAAHVYLYYVVPALRRQGIGAQLDDYVTRLFSARDCRELTLMVSASNHNAIAFYKARGWVSKGEPGGRPGELLMERRLT